MPAGRFTGEAAARSWLASACPHVWGLLNSQARQVLPLGLAEFLMRGDVTCGRQHLTFADTEVAALVHVCGESKVADAYRRDLSNVATEAQLAQHLCELSVAVALCRLAGSIRLRPRTGRGETRSDFAVDLAGVCVYGEVKRYDDTAWFTASGRSPRRGRSLVKSPPGMPVPNADRPRSMDLRSKLKNVPSQFPQGTANVLFVFHRSFGDSHRYLQAALFGDTAYGLESDAVDAPAVDGLFARPAWRTVSACYLTHLPPQAPEPGLRSMPRRLYCAPRWRNPQAIVPLPDGVRDVLDTLRPVDEWKRGSPRRRPTVAGRLNARPPCG